MLHLLNGEQYSGLERVVDHLAESAPNHGYRFHLVCLKPGEMPDRLKTRQAHLHFVRMRGRLDISCVSAIRGIAVAERCRLVHSHTVRGGLIARALRSVLPLPWLHHVHSPARYESENKRLNYLNYLVEQAILPKANHLLPVSQALYDYVRTFYRLDGENITVIQNGVESIGPDKITFANAGNTKTIGAVGLFRPRKGVEVLLDAFALLAARDPNVRLQLIGDFVNETYRRHITELVDRAGLSASVEFAGYQEAVGDHLAKLDVFVMPSLYGEGLPMALLEAMAMGCIIVASRIDGITEILGGGTCGILVSPGDATALADAIQDALADDIRNTERAAAARERQQILYRAEVMAKGVFDIYSRYLC